MDACNIFQMPSKQYLIQTNEHLLKSWRTAQQALLSDIGQVSSRAISTGGASAACLDGPKNLKYLRDQTQQMSSALGFTTESTCCSLWQYYKAHITWTRHWSTAVPVPGEISSHFEYESDMFLCNTLLTSWHNQFNISEICARTWRCWDTMCRGCQHLKTFLGSFQGCLLQSGSYSFPYSNARQCVLHFTAISC